MERLIEKCRQYLRLETIFTENSRRVPLLNPDFVYGDDRAYEVSVMKERFNF